MTNIRDCRLILTLVQTLFLSFACSSLHAASIVGDSVDIWSVAQSSGDEFFKDTVVVVDPGIEYTETILTTDIYDLNFGPTSISLVTLDDWYSPWFDSGFSPTRLEFRNIDVPGIPELSIGGVNVVFSETIVPEPGAPEDYPSFSADNVTFTPHSVILEIGPYSFPTGSEVQMDLIFVPEPSTATLMACGLLSAVILGRRRLRGA